MRPFKNMYCRLSKARKLIILFIARRYDSAVYDVVVYLSVCPS